MKGLLLDTNVVSGLRRPDKEGPAFGRWLSTQNPAYWHITSATRFELMRGVLAKGRKDPVQGLILRNWASMVLDEMSERTLAFDALCADQAAELTQGRTRSQWDTVIAATALTWGMPLVTRNVKDFSDIVGLSLINPWE